MLNSVELLSPCSEVAKAEAVFQDNAPLSDTSSLHPARSVHKAVCLGMQAKKAPVCMLLRTDYMVNGAPRRHEALGSAVLYL